MKTNFDETFLATDRGTRANEILRSCVHCGFCNATCPTYQLTGDELDGPRGRIYLIRELLETGANDARATTHLDRCLTCRACETTCPSGVAYGELAEIARLELGPGRSGLVGWLRRWLLWMVPSAPRTRWLARLGKPWRWLLPRRLAKNVPAQIHGLPEAPQAPDTPIGHVVLLNGCAQQVVTAATNQMFAALLTRHGVKVSYLREEACCGSLALHLGDEQGALRSIAQNIDALQNAGAPLAVDAIVSTASGCGVTVKDYARLMAHDAQYAQPAAAVAEQTLDASEYLQRLALPLRRAREEQRIAWHAPCTLQHGQQIVGVVEKLLESVGYELVPVTDGHLCCGSAGTYSILQPDFADELGQRKLRHLTEAQPELIATANVGCQSHLNAQRGAADEIEVVHWLELLR